MANCIVDSQEKMLDNDLKAFGRIAFRDGFNLFIIMKHSIHDIFEMFQRVLIQVMYFWHAL